MSAMQTILAFTEQETLFATLGLDASQRILIRMDGEYVKYSDNQNTFGLRFGIAAQSADLAACQAYSILQYAKTLPPDKRLPFIVRFPHFNIIFLLKSTHTALCYYGRRITEIFVQGGQNVAVPVDGPRSDVFLSWLETWSPGETIRLDLLYPFTVTFENGKCGISSQTFERQATYSATDNVIFVPGLVSFPVGAAGGRRFSLYTHGPDSLKLTDGKTRWACVWSCRPPTVSPIIANFHLIKSLPSDFDLSHAAQWVRNHPGGDFFPLHDEWVYGRASTHPWPGEVEIIYEFDIEGDFLAWFYLWSTFPDAEDYLVSWIQGLDDHKVVEMLQQELPYVPPIMKTNLRILLNKAAMDESSTIGPGVYLSASGGAHDHQRSGSFELPMTAQARKTFEPMFTDEWRRRAKIKQRGFILVAHGR